MSYWEFSWANNCSKGKKGVYRKSHVIVVVSLAIEGSLNLGAEFKGSKRYFFILKKGLINKNNTVAILFFLTAVPSFFCNVLKTWFELSRLKLYGSDLKGNKNYFELAESLSYRGFDHRG